MSLGKRIRAARQLRGWTLEEAAKRAGISVVYLCHIETEKRKPSKLSTLSAIIRAVATGEQQAELLAEATKIVLSN